MGKEAFRDQIERSKREKRSNIVVALDLTIEKPRKLLLGCLNILGEVSPYVCAVKVNRHLVLPLGLYSGVQKIVKFCQDLGLPTIMDCKINDIGDTNRIIAHHYFNVGFDALTANPFVGWEEGLKPVFDLAQKGGRGVILLLFMSHKGAFEGYGQTILDPESGEVKKQYEIFAKKALKWGADGAVVGATYPERIHEIYAILGERVPIYAPGIGFQGGKLELAIKAGARYLIVGRSIVQAEDPANVAQSFQRTIIKLLKWD